MRCAACNKDHDRQDSLCGQCATSAHHATELPKKEEPTMTDSAYFGTMVKQHNIGKQWWNDGLGLMEPADRFNHLWERAMEAFLAYRKMGLTQYKAFMKATGLKVIQS